MHLAIVGSIVEVKVVYGMIHSHSVQYIANIQHINQKSLFHDQDK